MLATKLQTLLRLLNGAPLEFSRDIIYPRLDAGFPGITPANEVKYHLSMNLLYKQILTILQLNRAKIVERDTIEDVQRIVELVQRDIHDIEDDLNTVRSLLPYTQLVLKAVRSFAKFVTPSCSVLLVGSS